MSTEKGEAKKWQFSVAGDQCSVKSQVTHTEVNIQKFNHQRLKTQFINTGKNHKPLILMT